MWRWVLGAILMGLLASAWWWTSAEEKVDDNGLTQTDRKHLRERRTATRTTTSRPAVRPVTRPVATTAPPPTEGPAPTAEGLDWEEEVDARVTAHLERGADPARSAIQEFFAVGAISEDALAAAMPLVDDLDGELADIQSQLRAGEIDTMEAARLVTEVQTETFTDVMGLLPPGVAPKMLKFLSAPTALPLDDEAALP